MELYERPKESLPRDHSCKYNQFSETFYEVVLHRISFSLNVLFNYRTQ